MRSRYLLLSLALVVLPGSILGLLVAGTRAAVPLVPTAIYVVNVYDDAGDFDLADGRCDADGATAGDQCTFRAAVQESNRDPGYDRIDLPSGVYSVTGDAVAITSTVEISGAQDTWVDSGQSDSGALFVQHGATVTITHVNFQNGTGSCFPVYGCSMGGQITNHGELFLADCTMRGGRGQTNGGAVANSHHLAVERCTFSDNRSAQVGGAIYSSGYDYDATLTVRDSTFAENMTGGGGGALYLVQTPALIENTLLQHNAAWGGVGKNAYGGALTVAAGGTPVTVTVRHTTFADNYSSASGGAIFASDHLVVEDGEFRYNQAAQRGGALFSQVRPVTLARTSLWGNEAVYGGGAIFLNGGRLGLHQSAVYSNTGRDGGAIYNDGGDLSLENATVSGNSAGRDGGGLFMAAPATTLLDYVTLTANEAAGNGGGLAGDSPAAVSNTIVANNSAASGPDCSGDTLNSAGYNVVGVGAGCLAAAGRGDQIGTDGSPLDPLLGPLRLNGGPVEIPTHALLSTASPAYDSANPGSYPAADQRGVARPYGAAPDGGAFELDPGVSASATPAPPSPLPFWSLATFPAPSPGATFTVDSTGTGGDDIPGDGICSGSQGCTLRAALEESNAHIGRDTVVLGADTYPGSPLRITDHLILRGQSYTTTVVDQGDYDLDYSTVVSISDITLQSGGRFLTGYGRLSLQDCVLKGNHDSSVFTFYSYGETMPVDDPFPDLTVTRCTFRDNATNANGGAINAFGPVTVHDSIFENNQAYYGGAIYASGSGIDNRGQLLLRGSTFSANSAEVSGGAIRHRWGRLTIGDSRFVDNRVTGTGSSTRQGGAIAAESWITVENSAFLDNYAYYAGGAIANGGNWNLDVDPALLGVSGSTFYSNTAGSFGGGVTFEGTGSFLNTTFSSNRAGEDGGGLLVAAESNATVDNSTFYQNVADADGDGSGDGGGLMLTSGFSGKAGTLTLGNTVLAGNTLGLGGAGPDCFLPAGHGASLGHNLVGAVDGCEVAWQGDDLTGTVAYPLAPGLGPIVDCPLGPPVHRPQAGSPVLDGGSNPLCAATDARGQLRPADGDEDGLAVCDIGAVEIVPKTFVVDSGALAGDATPGDAICADPAGACTFLAAAQEANAWDLHDTILVGAGTYSSAGTILTQAVTIQGEGAGTTILAGTGFGRVLRFGSSTTPVFAARLRALSVAGGNGGSGSGGGIDNWADLAVERVLVHDNQARYGGGVANRGAGTLTVEQSAIVTNTARYQPLLGSSSGRGGGIYNASGSSVTIRNSTVSGNEAEEDGGGLYQAGSRRITLQHTTVANNLAYRGQGGGVYRDSFSAELGLFNTIVGDNAAGLSDPDCFGTLSTSASNNIVEEINSNCTASGAAGVDAGLSLLADYGGDTLTHALAGRSPALNNGDTDHCLYTDQRTFLRESSCDLGAYEAGTFCVAPDIVDLGLSPQADDLLLSWSDVDAEYEVWWDDAQPYFLPGSECTGAGNCALRFDAEYTDPGVVVAGANRYYAVRSAVACGDISAPARAGLFVFTLVPGE